LTSYTEVAALVLRYQTC